LRHVQEQLGKEKDFGPDFGPFYPALPPLLVVVGLPAEQPKVRRKSLWNSCSRPQFVRSLNGIRTVFAVERISPDLKDAGPDGGNSIYTHEFDAVISWSNTSFRPSIRIVLDSQRKFLVAALRSPANSMSENGELHWRGR